MHQGNVCAVAIVTSIHHSIGIATLADIVGRGITTVPLPSGIALTCKNSSRRSGRGLPPVVTTLTVTTFVVFFVLLTRFGHVDVTLLVFTDVALYIFNATINMLVRKISFNVAYALNVVDLVKVVIHGNVVVVSCTRRLHRARGLYIHSTVCRSTHQHVQPVFLASTTTSVKIVPVVLNGDKL